MNFSINGLNSDKDVRLRLSNKVTRLNPNAAEFVPDALKGTIGNISGADAARLNALPASGKVVLDQLESNVSRNSDDEVHQYWCHQLPADITPDFKFLVEDELQEPEQLSLDGLSIHNGVETSKYSSSATGLTFDSQQEMSHLGNNNMNLSDEMGFSGPVYTENRQSTAFLTPAANYWDKQFMNGDQRISYETEGHHHNGDSAVRLLNGLFRDHAATEDTDIHSLKFLAREFPGFASDSLADVYYANGCDLNLTIEILTQLELQVDCSLSHNLSSKDFAAPTSNMLDFPALPVPDAYVLPQYTGEDTQQASSTFRSGISQYAVNFASNARKFASQDSGHWNYEKNSSASSGVGCSKNSQLLACLYNDNERLASKNKLRSFGAARAAPVGLESGEAVANMYSESRGEARDFARLRNACFEQARQAYIIGNKALAKELSVKGQLYNMKIEAHWEAREAIYQQRNSATTELLSYGRGQDHLIDLHGLHVNEAIHILKHELSILKSTARSAGKRLQVMICVGTGHHTKGSRTPAWLPVAVEQYLMVEGLHYTQPQPGLLRVLIY